VTLKKGDGTRGSLSLCKLLSKIEPLVPLGCSSGAASGAKRRKQPPFLNCDITLSLSIDVDALIVKVKGVKKWLRNG